MSDLSPFDPTTADFATWFDELPLWSAPFATLLLDHAPIRAGITVLDVGAGTGFLTIELAERCGPTSTIIAVDPWQHAMSRLRQKVDRLELGNVVCVEQDILTARLEAESLDLIVSNLGLNNFAGPQAALEVCYRAARSGADLLIATNVQGHMAEFYEIYRDTLIDLGHRSSLQTLDEHIRHRGTQESVSARIQSSGFAVKEVSTSTFTMRFADGSSMLRHHLIRAGFYPDWKAIAPVDHVDEVMRALEANLNETAAKNGSLPLTIPVKCLHAVKE